MSIERMSMSNSITGCIPVAIPNVDVDVDVTVDGGPPSAGDPMGSDRLVCTVLPVDRAGFTTGPLHFALLLSSGATSKLRSSLHSVQTPRTRARTFQRQSSRFGLAIHALDSYRYSEVASAGKLIDVYLAAGPIRYK
jgi:hypothetical protein